MNLIDASPYSQEQGERLSNRTFLACLHAYQPPRDILLPDGNRIDVVPSVNRRIYHESYIPMLREGAAVQPGVEFSLYPSLRYWIQQEDPDGWKQIQENISELPHPEYQVLGDPFVHVIMPHVGDEDQQMLLDIGKRAYTEDFGYAPKGLWLPETAVTSGVLKNARNTGFEFAVLRNDQVYGGTNPTRVLLGDGTTFPIVQFDAGVSGSIAFHPENTYNGETFYSSQQDKAAVSLGVDLETFGHHIPLADKFFEYVAHPDVIRSHGRAPFDVRQQLQRDGQNVGVVVENSSWSCEHGLGRWQGTCGCDSPSEKALADKQSFFSSLQLLNAVINTGLDDTDGQWRNDFADFVINNRQAILAGGDFISAVKDHTNDEIKRNLYLAKIYSLVIGMTSCGYFFGSDDRIERRLPHQSIQAAQQLITEADLEVPYAA